jgi:hypothetical protein
LNKVYRLQTEIKEKTNKNGKNNWNRPWNYQFMCFRNGRK